MSFSRISLLTLAAILMLVGLAGVAGGAVEALALGAAVEPAPVLALGAIVCSLLCLLCTALFLMRAISGGFPTAMESFAVVGPFILAMVLTGGDDDAMRKASDLVTPAGLPAEAMHQTLDALAIAGSMAWGLTIPIQLIALVVGFISLFGGNIGGKHSWND